MHSKSDRHNYRNTSTRKFTAANFRYKKSQHDRGYLSVFIQAFNKALAQLFTEKQFRALLHDGYTPPEPASNTATIEKIFADRPIDFFNKIRGKFSADTTSQKQEQKTEVLVLLQLVKKHTLQYYIAHDQWPDSLQEVSLPAASYATNSDSIDSIFTCSDGAITVEINESFGSGNPTIIHKP